MTGREFLEYVDGLLEREAERAVGFSDPDRIEEVRIVEGSEKHALVVEFVHGQKFLVEVSRQ